MNKKEIFKKVGMIMTELNDQYTYLSENPENLNDLELELFVANSNFLTDHIEILRKLNNVSGQSREAIYSDLNNKEHAHIPGQGSTGSVQISPEQPQSLTSVSAPADNTDDEHIPAIEIPATTMLENEDDLDNQITEQETQIESWEKLAESYPEEEVVKEIVIPGKTISVDAPVESKEPVSVPTINDLISARLNPSAVTKQFKPVGDLKTIISLNDKLLFIRDLFNGYSLAYSEAIELVNRFDSLEAADNFLKTNYASKNNWNDKQLTADKFYEILNRRFAK
ncbi:MAG TPA: hypothetical protein VNI52_02900 [Sphingobacteriaceae bacterium]|nr:hypothetical protein [Sphingobacteriaceae bacterium]